MKEKIKLEDWLSNLKYNTVTKSLNNKIGSVYFPIINIGGFEELTNILINRDTVYQFQNTVGLFILEAVNEKIDKLKTLNENWDKLEKILISKDSSVNNIKNVHFVYEGFTIIAEFYKNFNLSYSWILHTWEFDKSFNEKNILSEYNQKQLEELHERIEAAAYEFIEKL